MIKYILLVALIVAVQGAPQLRNTGNPKDSQITRSETDNDGTGKFHYTYETDQGIAADAVGELQPHPDPKEPPFVAVRGFWRYIDPEGNTQETKYIADHLGFRLL